MVDFKYYLYAKSQDTFFVFKQNFWYYYNQGKSKANVFYYTYLHNFNKNVVNTDYPNYPKL